MKGEWNYSTKIFYEEGKFSGQRDGKKEGNSGKKRESTLQRETKQLREGFKKKLWKIPY